jgi:sucrose 6(F)-phosphate phosphorylase
MKLKNQVQLITYADSLGGDLKTLNHVLIKYFPDVFKGGIHILPPFPSSGDRGFAPLTYLEIDPKFGTWEDIREIGEKFDLLLDLMVNHISKQSPYFQDFLKKGRESEYKDLFITLDKIWADGEPVSEDVDKMFLRRPQPFSTFTIEETGEQERVWTTFGKQDPSEQIDLDIHSEMTKNLLREFFENFSKQNIKIVRLDAVGYVVKKLGTSCFFVEPDIYDFLEWVKDMASSCGIELLPEVHAHYTTQFKLAERGYWIYDFILPYTILEAFINKDTGNLKKYLQVRPHKQFTMLDCHDGIPVKPDMNDLVSTTEARKVVDVCMQRGANLSLIFSDKHKDPDGFDVHQIRCTYYSALNSDDAAYLSARAIQFFTPGIPQVYYVGLLTGENDEECVKATGDGREINRHNYTVDEIEQAIERSAVQRLLNLIQFRNDYPAFEGEFSICDSEDDVICLSWKKEEHRCTLTTNMNTYISYIEYINVERKVIKYYI